MNEVFVLGGYFGCFYYNHKTCTIHIGQLHKGLLDCDTSIEDVLTHEFLHYLLHKFVSLEACSSLDWLTTFFGETLENETRAYAYFLQWKANGEISEKKGEEKTMSELNIEREGKN